MGREVEGRRLLVRDPKGEKAKGGGFQANGKRKGERGRCALGSPAEGKRHIDNRSHSASSHQPRPRKKDGKKGQTWGGRNCVRKKKGLSKSPRLKNKRNVLQNLKKRGGPGKGGIVKTSRKRGSEKEVKRTKGLVTGGANSRKVQGIHRTSIPWHPASGSRQEGNPEGGEKVFESWGDSRQS